MTGKRYKSGVSKKGSTLIKIFKILENPDHPSLGPQLRLLSLSGLWAKNQSAPYPKFMKCIFFITMAYFLSQYIKCFFNPDVLGSWQYILQFTPFHMGIVKSCFFKLNYSKWVKLIRFISRIELEQFARNDPKTINLVTDYIGRNRRITYFFWALALISNVSIFSEPFRKNEIVENGTSVYNKLFDGYMPFYQEEPPGYYFSMIIQSILGHVLSSYVIGFDTLTCAILIFFAGQLRITRLMCTRLITADDDSSHKNVVECHRFYNTLIRYQKTCNDLLSPILFVYLIVVAVNLGICIMQIAEITNDFSALASSCLFVAACLIQLLIFYWYGNEVIEENNLLSYGTFESNWVQPSLRLKKEVALIQIMTNKKIFFTAGPFNQLSLSTFVAILRASYSFYTLLNKTT